MSDTAERAKWMTKATLFKRLEEVTQNRAAAEQELQRARTKILELESALKNAISQNRDLNVSVEAAEKERAQAKKVLAGEKTRRAQLESVVQYLHDALAVFIKIK